MPLIYIFAVLCAWQHAIDEYMTFYTHLKGMALFYTALSLILTRQNSCKLSYTFLKLFFKIQKAGVNRQLQSIRETLYDHP